VTGVRTPDLDAYFREAKSWDQDRLASALRSRRFAWIIAGVASTVAFGACAAVAALAPLKSVTPFVVRVNDTTGSVEVMSALSGDKPTSYDEAVDKYFLAQYVRAREGWIAPAAEENFRFVATLSTPEEQERWAAIYRPTNTASPQTLWGDAGVADIAVRNIAFVNDRVANIRFHRTVRLPTEVAETDWIATVTFTYTAAPMAEADRLRNPLGFQVEGYRVDPEIVR
jgi:type IV secretion system protein VirB8